MSAGTQTIAQFVKIDPIPRTITPTMPLPQAPSPSHSGAQSGPQPRAPTPIAKAPPQTHVKSEQFLQQGVAQAQLHAQQKYVPQRQQAQANLNLFMKAQARTEERREGKECASKCKTRGGPDY